MSTVLNSGTSVPTAPSAAPSIKSGFIIGPWADAILIIGAPILALLIAAPLYVLPASQFDVATRTKTLDLRQVLITVFINAHLFLVFFRSHANQNIFQLYPLRFTVVPLSLFLLGAFSPAALIVLGMATVWWDVYHSSLQTFGFGRIYDAKQKNDAQAGRSLDYWMNLLVYTGPVLAGAHFIDHLAITTETMRHIPVESGTLMELFAQRTPDFLKQHQGTMAAIILAVGVPFVLYYLYSYYRLAQQGYRVSWQKVWLMIITSTVSIYCWGFRSFIDAFWVMNFFHALQYFAIVIFTEKRNLARFFRIEWFAYGWALAAFWVISVSLLYGLWAGYCAEEDGWSMSLVVTTSIMHFWYDGFIWSVNKKQV